MKKNKTKDVILGILSLIAISLMVGGVITLKTFWWCRTAHVEFKWAYPIGLTIPICAFIFWQIFKQGK